MKKLLISGAIAASAVLVGGAVFASTGNDNGHGDHGCHVGEQGNGDIINSHCPSPSPKVSPSPSPSVSPSVSPSPSPSVSPSTSPSPLVSPSPSPEATPMVLPAAGGTGRLHP